MATMNVSLPEPMKEWVEAQIEGGKYSSASDYVRDLIRRDQDHKSKRDALIQALIEGEESGVSKRTIEEIWAAARARARDASDGTHG